jgi:hypothetical protein
MIVTLQHAEQFLREYSKRLPGDVSMCQLKKRGIGEEEYARIKAHIPGIPESYLDVAKAYRLLDLELPLSFSASPAGAYGDSLFEVLRDGNSAIMGLYPRLQELDLTHVAGWEADYVCCYSDRVSERSGAIVLLGEYYDPTPVPLAPSFEAFLLLVCNLQQCVDMGEAAGIETFNNAVSELAGVTYVKGWKMIVEVVFS